MPELPWIKSKRYKEQIQQERLFAQNHQEDARRRQWELEERLRDYEHREAKRVADEQEEQQRRANQHREIERIKQVEEETRRQDQIRRQEEAWAAERVRQQEAAAREQELERVRLEDIRKRQEYQQLEENRRTAADEKRRADLKRTSPEAIRELRGLIRERYKLDFELWILRKAQVADRDQIMKICEKADGILKKIYDTVDSWDENLFGERHAEWEVALKIKQQLEPRKARKWTENPPWVDAYA